MEKKEMASKASNYLAKPGWLQLGASFSGFAISIYLAAVATALAKYEMLSGWLATAVFIPWLASALAFAGAAAKYAIQIFTKEEAKPEAPAPEA